MDKLRFGKTELRGTVHQSFAGVAGQQLPALELRLEGGVDAAALEAMQTCPLEILGQDGSVQGVHEGYHKLVRHSVLLARVDGVQRELEASRRECAALERENAALMLKVLTGEVKTHE